MSGKGRLYFPDAGSFIAMIALSTGRNQDLILGKPSGTVADMIIRRNDSSAEI